MSNTKSCPYKGIGRVSADNQRTLWEYLGLMRTIVALQESSWPTEKKEHAARRQIARLKKQAEKPARQLGMTGLEVQCATCFYFFPHSSWFWGVCRRQEDKHAFGPHVVEVPCYPRGEIPTAYDDYVCQDWTPRVGTFRPGERNLRGPSPKDIK
jgi:hypothetical protein